MAIPDYETIMLPLLKLMRDGLERSVGECIGRLAEEFGLSDEEKRHLLPSGLMPTFNNRVAWARTYMKQAGLLESTRRGFIKITERGRQILRGNPEKITGRLLSQFPEFVEFQSPKKETKETPAAQNSKGDQTPEEMLEYAHQRITAELSREILRQIRTCSPDFFERLVVELLVKMGYGGSLQEAGQAIGGSGDEGIDGIIKEDKLGLDTIYIQAKRWANSIGSPEIQKFVGALHGQKARKGIFVTTSTCTKDAMDYASKIDSEVVLIDGETLARFMIDHGLGVSTLSTYELKKIDTDYFAEE